MSPRTPRLIALRSNSSEILCFLELQLEGQLQRAGTFGQSNASEAGPPKHGCGWVRPEKVRVIEKIECRRLEIQMRLFADRKLLGERHIPVLPPGAAILRKKAAGITERECGCEAESRRVEIGVDALARTARRGARNSRPIRTR